MQGDRVITFGKYKGLNVSQIYKEDKRYLVATYVNALVQMQKDELKQPFIGKPGKFRLGNLGFPTKTTLRQFVSDWLSSSYHGYEVCTYDQDWVLELLTMHPRATLKLTGMVKIIIEHGGGHFHFSIVRETGDIEDISYIKCLQGETIVNNTLKALRHIIQGQIAEFRKAVFPKDDSRIICPITNIVLMNNQFTHIDHDFSKLTFRRLVDEFCAV